MIRFRSGLLWLLALASAGSAVRADEAVTPGPGFGGDHYATLWKNSPFAIATPDAPVASTDYSLVGIAQFDGISYASVIEKQTQEHFVISSDKPVKNLTLVSITRGSGGNKTSAVVQRNGEPLTLMLEEAPAVTSPGNPPPPLAAANINPSGNPSVGGMNYLNPGTAPPRARFRRPPIMVPSVPPSP